MPSFRNGRVLVDNINRGVLRSGVSGLSVHTINNTASPILGANSERAGVVITNKGGKDVWVAFQQDAVVGEGYLVPWGESRQLDQDFMCTKAISGIVDGTASVDVSVEELEIE